MPVNMGETEILIPVDFSSVSLYAIPNLHPLWMISLVSQATPFVEERRV